MKLARCEKQHIYPSDRYSKCPFCSGLINDKNRANFIEYKPVNSQKINLSKEQENKYSIPEMTPTVYTDRIWTKADKMAAMPKRELHINTKQENRKIWLDENTRGLRYFFSILGELLSSFAEHLGDD